MRKGIALCILSFMAYFGAEASHIAGGDLEMRATKNVHGRFEITLNLYFDEISATDSAKAQRNRPKIVTIYELNTNRTIDVITLDYYTSAYLRYTNPACAAAFNINVTQLIYHKGIDLDPQKYNSPNGYRIVFSNCARNSTIVNVMASGRTCSEFYLEFPPLIKDGKAFYNSSPRFNIVNGEHICLREPFKIPFVASDDDGDELHYKMATPAGVSWVSGYDENHMISGNPPLTIDPQTGFLRVTAEAVVGLHVFAVEVSEYRNGEKIGSVFREFQIIVADCPPTNLNNSFVYTIEDTTRSVQNLDFCPSKSVDLFTQTNKEWHYQWQKNGENIAGATKPTYKANSPGSYAVVISMAYQCGISKTTEETILKYRLVKSKATWDSIAVFCGLDAPLFLLTASPAGGIYDGKGLTTDGKYFSPKLASYGTHQLTYTLNDPISGCDYNAIRWAVVSQNPIVKLGQDRAIQKGQSIQLSPTLSKNTVKYEWSPIQWLNNASAPNPIASPTQTTTYGLTASFSNGCKSTDDIIITVYEKLTVANAFTPNGDGLNDVWELQGIQNFPDAEIKIYNRWGHQIFYSKGYVTPFDGQQNGEALPITTYYYVIELHDGQDTMKGTLTILK